MDSTLKVTGTVCNALTSAGKKLCEQVPANGVFLGYSVEMLLGEAVFIPNVTSEHSDEQVQQQIARLTERAIERKELTEAVRLFHCLDNVQRLSSRRRGNLITLLSKEPSKVVSDILDRLGNDNCKLSDSDLYSAQAWPLKHWEKLFDLITASNSTTDMLCELALTSVSQDHYQEKLQYILESGVDLDSPCRGYTLAHWLLKELMIKNREAWLEQQSYDLRLLLNEYKSGIPFYFNLSHSIYNDMIRLGADYSLLTSEGDNYFSYKNGDPLSELLLLGFSHFRELIKRNQLDLTFRGSRDISLANHLLRIFLEGKPDLLIMDHLVKMNRSMNHKLLDQDILRQLQQRSLQELQTRFQNEQNPPSHICVITVGKEPFDIRNVGQLTTDHCSVFHLNPDTLDFTLLAGSNVISENSFMHLHGHGNAFFIGEFSGSSLAKKLVHFINQQPGAGLPRHVVICACGTASQPFLHSPSFSSLFQKPAAEAFSDIWLEWQNKKEASVKAYDGNIKEVFHTPTGTDCDASNFEGMRLTDLLPCISQPKEVKYFIDHSGNKRKVYTKRL